MTPYVEENGLKGNNLGALVEDTIEKSNELLSVVTEDVDKANDISPYITENELKGNSLTSVEENEQSNTDAPDNGSGENNEVDGE